MSIINSILLNHPPEVIHPDADAQKILDSILILKPVNKTNVTVNMMGYHDENYMLDRTVDSLMLLVNAPMKEKLQNSNIEGITLSYESEHGPIPKIIWSAVVL